MKNEKIAWEPHPVTPERKAELRAEGFTIVDARFKPAQPQEQEAATNADEQTAVQAPQEAAAKRGRKPAQPQE